MDADRPRFCRTIFTPKYAITTDVHSAAKLQPNDHRKVAKDAKFN